MCMMGMMIGMMDVGFGMISSCCTCGYGAYGYILHVHSTEREYSVDDLIDI